MKGLKLYLLLTLFSLSIMAVVDYLLGDKAEFLNAWSVMQRLFGVNTDAGNSIVYQHYGQLGELVCVLVANMIFAAILMLIVHIKNRFSS